MDFFINDQQDKIDSSQPLIWLILKEKNGLIKWLIIPKLKHKVDRYVRYM